jgi:hypothetical protein
MESYKSPASFTNIDKIIKIIISHLSEPGRQKKHNTPARI